MSRYYDSALTVGTEYRVVWRFREKGYGEPGPAHPVRRRAYKTRAGAERLLAKLRSNGGRYDQHVETEPTRYDDGLLIVHLVLDFARLEVREVGGWHAPCDCGEYVPDSSGESGCGNCGADIGPLESVA